MFLDNKPPLISTRNPRLGVLSLLNAIYPPEYRVQMGPFTVSYPYPVSGISASQNAPIFDYIRASELEWRNASAPNNYPQSSLSGAYTGQNLGLTGLCGPQGSGGAHASGKEIHHPLLRYVRGPGHSCLPPGPGPGLGGAGDDEAWGLCADEEGRAVPSAPLLARDGYVASGRDSVDVSFGTRHGVVQDFS